MHPAVKSSAIAWPAAPNACVVVGELVSEGSKLLISIIMLVMVVNYESFCPGCGLWVLGGWRLWVVGWCRWISE